LPVIVQVEQKHLWLSCLQNPITEFLNLKTCLERQLQLTSLDDDVREVKQMNLERVKHALAGHDDLLWLFFDWQTSDQSSNFFGSFPLCKLTKTFLAFPNASVDDLEEELARLRVEDEDSTVDWFCRQVAFKSLVDCHTVNIRIINEPNDLVREEFCVVLRVEVWFRWFTRVQL